MLNTGDRFVCFQAHELEPLPHRLALAKLKEIDLLKWCTILSSVKLEFAETLCVKCKHKNAAIKNNDFKIAKNTYEQLKPHFQF